MPNLSKRGAGWAMVAGAALLAAGCGTGDDAANRADANALDANLMLEGPGNDASAMESAVNATEPVAVNSSEDGNASDVLGETRGGDTGGNTIESNASGT